MSEPWLLVTTSRSLLLLNGRNGKMCRLDHGRGLYYGIDRFAGLTYVAARGRMVSSSLPAEQERGTILIFDKQLRPIKSLAAPFPMRDIHQILHYDKRLWITCSFDNLIAVFDGENWEAWYPLGEPISEPRDRNHFNSLAIIDGLLWIVAHNKGDSELLAFAPDTREFVQTIRLGRQAHNLWRQGDEWCTCSSADGKLIGNCGFELITGGFPRGIAWLDDEIYVGISQIAERENRDFTSGELQVYDRHWRARRVIGLPDEGLVLDVFPVAVNFSLSISDERVLSCMPLEAVGIAQ